MDTDEITTCEWAVGGNVHTGAIFLCRERAVGEHSEYGIPVCSEHLD